MSQACGTTRGAGNNRAYEDAVNTRIDGELQEVESDLPEDIRDRALSMFRAAISNKFTVQQAIEKVNKEALVEVEERFKGQRFKVVKITITVRLSSGQSYDPRSGEHFRMYAAVKTHN